MKRAQKIALSTTTCSGACPEARQLAADLEASGEALDRRGAEVSALETRVVELEAEVRTLRAQVAAAGSLRRGLAA